MRHLPSRVVRLVVLIGGLCAVTRGEAEAQGPCLPAQRAAVGAAMGRSMAEFTLSTSAAPAGPSQSVLARQSGLLWSVRGDWSPAGRWRTRVDWQHSRRGVRRDTYGPASAGSPLVARESLGHIGVSSVGAAVGRSIGQRPRCGYVLIGAGAYAVDYRDTTTRLPGGSATAGFEVATGRRSAIQFEAQLHLLAHLDRGSIRGYTPFMLGLSAGWVLGLGQR